MPVVSMLPARWLWALASLRSRCLCQCKYASELVADRAPRSISTHVKLLLLRCDLIESSLPGLNLLLSLDLGILLSLEVLLGFLVVRYSIVVLVCGLVDHFLGFVHILYRLVYGFFCLGLVLGDQKLETIVEETRTAVSPYLMSFGVSLLSVTESFLCGGKLRSIVLRLLRELLFELFHVNGRA